MWSVISVVILLIAISTFADYLLEKGFYARNRLQAVAISIGLIGSVLIVAVVLYSNHWS